MYGAWGVVVSLIGYYGIFDVGIRSAVGHRRDYHAPRPRRGQPPLSTAWSSSPASALSLPA
jgi:hypothetical protein